MDEEKYTAITFMFKNTPDHNIDTFFDLIDNWLPECSEDECTCGMISMGGCSGSEEQCWKHLGLHESVCEVKTEDLKVVVNYINQCPSPPSVVWQAMKRLRDEAYWWDEIDERLNGE